jgi:hypothetical protein
VTRPDGAVAGEPLGTSATFAGGAGLVAAAPAAIEALVALLDGP